MSFDGYVQTWIVTKTATHPEMSQPVVQTIQLKGKFEDVVSKIKLDDEERIAFTNNREVSFKDAKGGLITITIRPFILVSE
jgi:hypothetical protein